MQAAKKQVEFVGELETELAKARKQEKAYEEAIESLNKDLDTLEQENAKIKQSTVPAVTPTRPSAGLGSSQSEPIGFTGSLETAHLLSYIEGLRGSLRFLKSENSFLKSRSMVSDLDSLPPLPSSGKKDDQLRVIIDQTRALWKDTMSTTSQAAVVDLSRIEPTRKWQKHSSKPETQLERQRAKMDRLKSRFASLQSTSAFVLPSVVNISA